MKMIILLGFVLPLITKGQQVGDSVSISFLFQQTKIQDSADLDFKVIYQNISNRGIGVYENLEEGELNDRLCNFSFELQRKNGGRYATYSLGTYKRPAINLSEDSIQDFDLPKRILAVDSKDTLCLNLLSIAYQLDSGFYRLRAHLRIKSMVDKAIWADLLTGPPPDQKIIYFTSKWFYFFCRKDLRRPHLLNKH